MTITVDYVPIANDVGANVESQAQYLTDLGSGGSLQHGYVAGVAQSAQVNKTLRQVSMIAAALAHVVSSGNNADLLDDGNLTNLIAAMTSGIRLSVANSLTLFSSAAAGAFLFPVAPNVFTKIICSVVIEDNLTEYNPTTGVFTPTKTGWYQFATHVLGSTVNISYIINLAIANSRSVGIARASDDVILSRIFRANPITNALSVGGVTEPLYLTAGEGVYMQYKSDVGDTVIQEGLADFTGTLFSGWRMK